MFPVQDVVDGQRTDHCAGKGEVHAAVTDDRHKETKEIGAEPYAEVISGPLQVRRKAS